MNALAAILGFFVLKPMINARLKTPAETQAKEHAELRSAG